MRAFQGPAPRCDAAVLAGVQFLVIGLPFAVGGRETWAQASAAAIAAILLGLWVYKTRRLGNAPVAPGVRAPIYALLAFSTLVIAQTIPLPSSLLATVSPRAHALFMELLPGWPGSGWSAARPLALEPLAAQAGLLCFGPAFAVFALIAAYPWGAGPADRNARRLVFGRLVATLCVSATAIAAVAILQQLNGDDALLFFSNPYGHDRYAGRAHSPYVNPNHLAGYLEMLIPLGAIYGASVATRLLRRLERRTDAARHSELARHRSWIMALVGAQRRLIPPLVALAALGIVLTAHRATESRGGRVALAVAALVCLSKLVFARVARHRVRRAAVAALGILALGAALGGQFLVGSAEETVADRSIDPSLGTRLVVISQAAPLLREFPWLGAGLGSWPHAFRLTQRPPIERWRWSHAHNDYLQFGVETGLAGVIILVVFAWAVARAARGGGAPSTTAGTAMPAASDTRRLPAVHPLDERADWTAAFQDWSLLRTGLIAGLVALCVHALSDFNFQIAANTFVFMTLAGLLVLSAAPESAPRDGAGRGLVWAPVGLIAVLCFAIAGPLFGLAPFRVAGGASAWARMDEAQSLFAIEEEAGRARAVTLARSAVELAPLEPGTHELLGRIVADAAEGDGAYRRAIWLSPNESPLRDALAVRLWQRGDREEALVEFEESMRDVPVITDHAYLTSEDGLEPTTPRGRLRALAAGESLQARLQLLDPAIRSAIERGLRGALDAGEVPQVQVAVIDLATLLESNGRFADAAALIEEWVGAAGLDAGHLRRAAANYLAAGESAAAERVLAEQLARTPDDGELYRLLAVDVYAAQHDFDAAELVLAAGQRNSADLLPIYRAMREVLILEQYRGRAADGRPENDGANAAQERAVVAREHGP